MRPAAGQLLTVLPRRPQHDHPLHDSLAGCRVGRAGSHTALLPGGQEARPPGLSTLAPGGRPWLLRLAPKAPQVFSRDEPDKDMDAAPVTSWA